MKSNIENPISIVIAVNKSDYWFCKICVASIRYFYPQIPIYLLKDELNGKFSTSEIEKAWNVHLIDLGIKKFGWSASKIFFYTDTRFLGQKYLVLDSDIVFAGRVLDLPFVRFFNADVIINEEIVNDPNEEWFKNTYFDTRFIQQIDKHYEFPGYSFNCGQLFCKGSFLAKEQLDPYFDFGNFPFWKSRDMFPMVDQSVLNHLLPKLSKDGKLKIRREKYMIWSETDQVHSINIQNIKSGDSYPFMIHWAGALRTPYLSKMTSSNVLIFFENYYYKQIKFSFLKKNLRKIIPFIFFYKRIIIKSLKRSFKSS